MSSVSSHAVLQAAIQFIWREAEYLDSRNYPAWLALWTADGRYIIPLERNVVDHAAALNVVYDDAAMRDARVQRLMSGASMSADSAARTVRTVSRFVLESADENVLVVRCAQHIIEHKRDESRMLGADVTYHLALQGGAFALDQKIVCLVNNDDALHGIGYLF